MQNKLTPPLKWAGGKRWLVPFLQKVYTFFPDYRLVEPFVGGMSVALGLQPKDALLNDANQHLINFYQQIQLGLQFELPYGNNESEYYQAREQFNDRIADRQQLSKESAQLFYYLIKTGFNGLCRFNKSGYYNVPFGRHKTINYLPSFDEYAQAFDTWQLSVGDFADISIASNDFLYVDPPYDVEFTHYHSTDFVWSDQERLVDWLSSADCPTIISNQATTRVKKLYKQAGFKLYLVDAPRFISCNGSREKALEVVAVKNMPRRAVIQLNKMFTKA
ncbi:DNA adenine methylase [Agaribacter flavus]|uniref:site-specific DNA-methyltransferase (adenine-specific) n=1 Tax=Agaribacter flavus TaxID=1902781 RepID=A0ABV7FX12_9ALTE